MIKKFFKFLETPNNAAAAAAAAAAHECLANNVAATN
jgi:hypothetical protein